MSTKKITVTLDEDKGQVLLIVNGICVANMSYQAADAVARALSAKARQCEEWHSRDQIADDNALLLRVGANIGLSNRADVLEESVKRAVSDRYLRTRVPGGVKSSEAVGTPTIIGGKK